MHRAYLVLLFSLLVVACKQKNAEQPQHIKHGEKVTVKYAKGFSITDYPNFKILTVTSPWSDANHSFTYALKQNGASLPDSITYDQEVEVPIKTVVATSTTHLPAIESLNETQSLKGFPGLDYISSKSIRQRIANGKIKELGKNESINTELLINLNPDAVIAFSVDSENKALNQAQKSGIPVIYNGDWTENNPLGKAEWIKFFGALYGKLDLAQQQFKKIEDDYHKALSKIKDIEKKPLVLSGSLYKDVWYLPYGNSWQAQMIADAGGKYLYKNTKGSGSMSLSFEEVLDNGRQADKWIAPGSFTSYSQMKKASGHYTEFKAFQQREIYTYASTKGDTGGVLYYELAPQRPDLVLKDLIKIFHPGQLPNYKPVFFKPLEK